MMILETMLLHNDSNSQMSLNDKKHLIKRFLSAYEDHSKTVVNPKLWLNTWKSRRRGPDKEELIL